MSSAAVMPQQGRQIEVIVDDGKLDKIGELVDQLDNVKLNNNDEKSTGCDKNGVTTLDHKVVKHPLQNSWTLWFFKKDGGSWSDNHRPIITVSTVEDFWSLYNHIEVASKLPVGTDYSMFKEGIYPDWEDKRNTNGGRWMINLDRRHRAEFLDTYWLETLFFLIGENADQYAYQVNGAVVSVRAKADRLAIWLADASQPDSLLRIGKMIKERLRIDPSERVSFKVHDDERTKEKSGIKRQKLVV